MNTEEKKNPIPDTLAVRRRPFGTGVSHLIQINKQPDAIIFQFIILTFV
jgi:hypothetical protein